MRQSDLINAHHHLSVAWLLAVALLAAILGPGAARAQTNDSGENGVTQPAAPDPDVSARLIAEATSLTVGDPAVVLLEVRHPAGTQILPPDLGVDWDGLEVRVQGPVTTIDNGDGTLTTNQAIEVVLFAPGQVETPPLAVTVSDARGQVSQALAAPVTLVVDSVLVEGDAELRDIKPQAELAIPSLLPYQIGGSALLILLLLGLAWSIYRRFAHQALIDTRPADQVALDELERISGLGLAQAGRYKRHYSLVTDALRAYIERAYRVPTMDRTTVEIKRGLYESNMEPATVQAYVDLFAESDLVKFADMVPSEGAAENLVKAARALVRHSVSELAATTVTDEPAPAATAPTSA